MHTASLAPVSGLLVSSDHPVSVLLAVAAVVLELAAMGMYALSGRAGRGSLPWGTGAKVLAASGGLLMVGALGTLGLSELSASVLAGVGAAVLAAVAAPFAVMARQAPGRTV